MANNYRKAPILKYDVPKDNSNQFYAIPQDVADEVFRVLGNKSAQLRIMLVLIGTKPGFAISEAWILERTGIAHDRYIKARKELAAMGWLTLESSKSITVNFNAILNKGGVEPPQKNFSGVEPPQISGVKPLKISGVKPPIINKETDKITDTLVVSSSIDVSASPQPQIEEETTQENQKVEELKEIEYSNVLTFWGDGTERGFIYTIDNENVLTFTEGSNKGKKFLVKGVCG